VRALVERGKKAEGADARSGGAVRVGADCGGGFHRDGGGDVKSISEARPARLPGGVGGCRADERAGSTLSEFFRRLPLWMEVGPTGRASIRDAVGWIVPGRRGV